MPSFCKTVPLRTLAATLALLSAVTVSATSPPAAPRAQMIDWDRLLPPGEHYSSTPPAPVHDYLGEAGKPMRQTGSAKVNEKLAETMVKIPGYVVPVIVDSKGVISEFFLVPYLGSCVHVPPPPPNQLVYVRLAGGGIRLGTLEEPFWITGRLHVQVSRTRLATAAYTLDAQRMERYQY